MSTLAKSAQTWAVPCPGSVCSSEYQLARELAQPIRQPALQPTIQLTTRLTTQPTTQRAQVAVTAAVSGGRLGDVRDVQAHADSARMARLRQVWLSQNEQGRSVFSGINPIAPAAHMGATKRGVQGPKPWRRLA